MKDKPKLEMSEEKRSRLSDKKLDADILGKVAGGKGEGIKGVAYTETVDISESVQNKI